MSSFLIIILAIILLALIILNNIKIVSTENVSASNCTQTTFGCCPNGVDSKINYYGTNCPMFNPGPGYQPGPGPPGPGPPGPGPPGPGPPGPGPPGPGPPGPGPPGPGPGPGPMPPKPIGGCVGTRFGCCANSQTPKINVQGSNCVLNQ
jgi:hypothetical protein